MVPDYQTLMLPVLEACSERMVSTKEIIADLADQYDLSAEEREQLVPSGRQTTLANRINWAKTYLKQAGLVCYPVRSQFEITAEGRQVLQTKPKRIDSKFLEQFKSFRQFRP